MEEALQFKEKLKQSKLNIEGLMAASEYLELGTLKERTKLQVEMKFEGLEVETESADQVKFRTVEKEEEKVEVV